MSINMQTWGQVKSTFKERCSVYTAVESSWRLDHIMLLVMVKIYCTVIYNINVDMLDSYITFEVLSHSQW